MYGTRFQEHARSLPADMDAAPVISKADASANPILSMTVQSNTRNSTGDQ
jgi:hypothetical protein